MERIVTRFLFGTGLARSGGALYSMALSAHPQVEVAVCPNLEFFRSFRNAAFREATDLQLTEAFAPTSSFQDWYGTDTRIAALDHILSLASLDIEFPLNEWPSFIEKSTARGRLECSDLANRYGELHGETYREVLASLLCLIKDQRKARGAKYVGFHEVWTIDFFPVLARAFPDATFLVMLRDPRAIISSMLAVRSNDASQVAQVLSYVRHWRKYVALSLRFLDDPLFAGRLHVTAHERVLLNPRKTLNEMCSALDIEFQEEMLNTRNYWDHASGSVWKGNGSFEATTSGISVERAKRWREVLSESMLSFIEFLCGRELQQIGYSTFTDYASLETSVDESIANSFFEDYRAEANWRSDLDDETADFELEVLRRHLLSGSIQAPSRSTVRRLFLLDEQYVRLCQAVDRALFPDLAGLWLP